MSDEVQTEKETLEIRNFRYSIAERNIAIDRLFQAKQLVNSCEYTAGYSLTTNTCDSLTTQISFLAYQNERDLRALKELLAEQSATGEVK